MIKYLSQISFLKNDLNNNNINKIKRIKPNIRKNYNTKLIMMIGFIFKYCHRSI